MASPVSKEQYRLKQEAFVSYHGGTTPYEVFLTILPNACAILLATTTLGVLRKYTHRNVNVIIEFVLTIVPCILCYTVLSDYIGTTCIVMISVSVLNIMWLRKERNVPLGMQPIIDRKPFITYFRALTNIITTICILAVDFQIFPRRFAKTEVFGYSLMDTGVGLFVLANALVAPQTKDFSISRTAGFQETLMKNIKNCVRNCIPLLLLGFGRFIVVEYINYQKHVSEYGIHWNFFITLAVVKFFTSLITSTVSSKYSLLSGIWILGMHEYIMNTKGLKKWVLRNGPRDNLLSANREGLISIPGYVGLYFFGIAIGRVIHSTYQSSCTRLNNNTSVKLFNFEFVISYNAPILLCIKLSFICAHACIATFFCDSYFKVSRRLANAGYCMWILSLTTIVLIILQLTEFVLDLVNHAADVSNISKTERLRKSMRLNLKKSVDNEREENRECVVKKSLEIFDAVNYNGLFFFLFSNVMTGFVNMLMYTLYAKQSVAILILIVYMAVSICPTLILYRQQIQIKL